LTLYAAGRLNSVVFLRKYHVYSFVMGTHKINQDLNTTKDLLRLAAGHYEEIKQEADGCLADIETVQAALEGAVMALTMLQYRFDGIVDRLGDVAPLLGSACEHFSEALGQNEANEHLDRLMDGTIGAEKQVKMTQQYVRQTVMQGTQDIIARLSDIIRTTHEPLSVPSLTALNRQTAPLATEESTTADNCCQKLLAESSIGKPADTKKPARKALLGWRHVIQIVYNAASRAAHSVVLSSSGMLTLTWSPGLALKYVTLASSTRNWRPLTST
jgi:hypothetical protein